MLRSKIVKRKTKNKETLLRNLRKGKARLEDRCAFQNIPYPLKFICPSQVYHLCGDIVLMEHNNTILLENSLLNNFKIYKHSQILSLQNQKLVRVLVENKDQAPLNWKYVVDKLSVSDSENLREWAGPIRSFGERYEEIVKTFGTDLELETRQHEIQILREVNDKADETRKHLISTYPYFELKSQFKNGRIQLTEMLFNEKFLTELGYSAENFSATMFQEGLPKLMPYENRGCQGAAKVRLEKFLKITTDGFMGPEVECNLLMKSGYLKKVKFVSYYYPTLDKGGVPGYSVFLILVARQKATLNPCIAETKLNPDFVQMMSRKEQEMDDFLNDYYGESVEKTYTNINKVCKIKEIDVRIA